MQIISIAIFAGVLVLLITDKVNRTLAALIGAMLVFLLGIIPFEESMEYIDFNTLGVLVGMMLYVAVAKRSGIFEFVAIKAAKLAKGDPWRIMVFLVIITAVFSALLDNVTTVLLIGPMTFMICKKLKVNPVPFFLTQILASNIGGTATLIGDPPNIMIGSAADLSFLDFLLVDGPAALLIMLASIIAFSFIYGRNLHAEKENVTALMLVDEHEVIVSKSLFIKSIVMIIVATVGFLLHGALHINSAVIALSIAGIMLIIGKQNVEDIIQEIEWSTIGFFAGLFVVVGGMISAGVMDLFSHYLISLVGDNLLAAVLLVLVASALISAVVDNIPFVAAMIPVIVTLGASGLDIVPLWWALSLGACLGGNGTIIGASSNVVLVCFSNKQGYPITYWNFLKIGAPITLLSIVIAGIYLFLRFHL